MFVSRERWNEFELRQGDVLAGISFPLVPYAALPVVGRLNIGNHGEFPNIRAHIHPFGANQGDYFTAQVTMKLSFCVVTSHCCELVTNQQHKLRMIPAISIARLVPLMPSMLADPEKLASVR